jgi:membrane protein implicated in regulation of membrane protease activity
MYRCAQGCIAFSLLAAAAFFVRVQVAASLSTWLQLVGFGACALALVAAIAAAVYRKVEAPQEVTVRDPRDWLGDPPVIHLRRKD